MSFQFFDPAFDFHFYDLGPLCQTAREKGLRLGTWHISITHNSGGELRLSCLDGKAG